MAKSQRPVVMDKLSSSDGPPMIEVMGWKLVCTHNIILDGYSMEIF